MEIDRTNFENFFWLNTGFGVYGQSVPTEAF
jgi:hypothetical protein